MSGPPAPRVLVLGTVFGQPMGGVRRHNAELLPRAARILEERGGSLSVLEALGGSAVELPPGIGRITTDAIARPAAARWVTEGPAARRALAAGGGARFDVVHTAHLPVPRLPATPLTVTLHDLRRLDPSLEGPAGRFTATLALRRAVRRARLLVAVSEAVREELVARLRADPARVRVVPNAADHFEPRPRAPGPDAPLLCVGHLEPRKNVEILLRALAADPELPRLQLAGAAKAGEEARLRALARDLGVESRVAFLGAFADEDLPRLYAACACVVLPSRLEGFGIPAAEARRAGAPLAVARTPALLEVAGADAPAFSPDDPAECARAIRAALVASPESLRRAADHASRFGWDASARALVDVWTEAAPPRVSAPPAR